MKLLSEHEDVLAEFNSGQVAVPADSDNGGWIEVSSEARGRRAGPGSEGRGSLKPRPRGLWAGLAWTVGETRRRDAELESPGG